MALIEVFRFVFNDVKSGNNEAGNYVRLPVTFTIGYVNNRRKLTHVNKTELYFRVEGLLSETKNFSDHKYGTSASIHI